MTHTCIVGAVAVAVAGLPVSAKGGIRAGIWLAQGRPLPAYGRRCRDRDKISLYTETT
jgi:tetrahydrodipicolinate N-succinyltransferase